MEAFINLSTQNSLLARELQRRQLAYERHPRVASQVWNPYMPMEQVQHEGHLYLNTYNLGCQHHPHLSWETNENIPHPPQAKESNLEDEMAKLANSIG